MKIINNLLIFTILLILLVILCIFFNCKNKCENFENSMNYNNCVNQGYPYNFCIKTYQNTMNKSFDCYLKI